MDRTSAYVGWVKIRLLKHTGAPQLSDCGSFEVRFPHGRPSIYFYWDDNPGRRSITQKSSAARKLRGGLRPSPERSRIS
jgi:hypothetical protein